MTLKYDILDSQYYKLVSDKINKKSIYEYGLLNTRIVLV